MIHYKLHPLVEAFTTERFDALPTDIILPVQTHSSRVAVVRCADVFPDTDALVTNIPNQLIGIRTADCVPVLLVDPQHKVVAAAHAGWRGTVGQIVSHTIATMQSEFGCDPAHMHAVIGPSISPEAFEVGPEVVEQFVQADFPEHVVLRNYGRPHVNLWEANRWLLCEAGLPPEHIQLAGLCTVANTHRFFSARCEGIGTGRLVSAIRLLGEA